MVLPLGDTRGKEPVCQCRRHEMQVGSLGWEDPLEEGMTTYSSIPDWSISWTEASGGLQSIGSQKVGYNWSDLAGMYLYLLRLETLNWQEKVKSSDDAQLL